MTIFERYRSGLRMTSCGAARFRPGSGDARRLRHRTLPIVVALEERVALSSATTTSLALSADSLTVGQKEVLTATVTTDPPSGTTPTGGTVSFMDGATRLGTAPLLQGTATFATTALSAGSHLVTADYGGTSEFAGSTSATGAPTITTAVRMESLSAPPNTVVEDSTGTLFIAISYAFETDVVMEKGGNFSVLAGDGSGTAADYSGPGTGLDLSGGVWGVALYGGYAYVAGNREVFKVNIATDQTTTVESTGANPSPYLDADAVCVDAQGDLFIACNDTNVIREVNAATGDVSVVAGDGTRGYSGDGGPATSAELFMPSNVAVDASGDLFIADSGNGLIREVSASTGDITTVAGGGTDSSPTYSGPATGLLINGEEQGVAADNQGNLYIADSAANVIREVNLATDQMSTIAGTGTYGYSGDGGPAALAELSYPEGVAMSPNGNLLIADSDNSVIRVVTAGGGGQSILVSPAGSGGGGGGGSTTTTQVESVALAKIKLGKHKTSEAIVLQFNEALNATDAQEIGVYSLVTTPKSKRQKSKVIALAKASYNPTALTVTLTTRKALVLSSPIKLTVNASGLLDSAGDPLDGGTNFSAVLAK
jgi:hypothetical protein